MSIIGLPLYFYQQNFFLNNGIFYIMVHYIFNKEGSACFFHHCSCTTLEYYSTKQKRWYQRHSVCMCWAIDSMTFILQSNKIKTEIKQNVNMKPLSLLIRLKHSDFMWMLRYGFLHPLDYLTVLQTEPSDSFLWGVKVCQLVVHRITLVKVRV